MNQLQKKNLQQKLLKRSKKLNKILIKHKKIMKTQRRNKEMFLTRMEMPTKKTKQQTKLNLNKSRNFGIKNNIEEHLNKIKRKMKDSKEKVKKYHHILDKHGRTKISKILMLNFRNKRKKTRHNKMKKLGKSFKTKKLKMKEINTMLKSIKKKLTHKLGLTSFIKKLTLNSNH